ncbi:MAG: SRPBCC domain-containing protein [Phenylobacterium sp.]|uniref:SRPBCC family protein n=1 Tax=Phenylobacterium sp. TaxID=1871053 RepID=UPI0027328255|nr:SRPBCC domain-containing protein [Phenylobacterium sp.]MDP3749663.1 SRPBCC domain-containing protein [Phenylobacterium sp.]
MTTSLTLVRRIRARPAIVFDALTTAEGVGAWWGPDDLPVILAEVDARVGGSFRVRFQTLDGQEHEVCGEYLEVVPPHRVAMTWRYVFGGEPEEFGRVSRIECDLAPIAGGTELTFTHAGLRNEASLASHEQGWTGSMTKLVGRLGQL